MKQIRTFDEMMAYLSERRQPKRIAVVCGVDDHTREAVERAHEMGFAEPVFVNNDDVDVAARDAVAMVRRGEADVLMKGLINTDNLLRAVLNRDEGILPRGRVLTHIAATQLPNIDRLLLFTDAAVIPYPTQEQRTEQVRYVCHLAHALGVDVPRISLIHCTEKVNGKHFPFTEGYADIIRQGQEGLFGPCVIDGPLDLKTSLDAHSLHTKGIDSPLEGEADALVFPEIVAANVFYKTITLYGASTAALLQGAQVSVVLTSRSDSTQSKIQSLALAAL